MTPRPSYNNLHVFTPVCGSYGPLQLDLTQVASHSLQTSLLSSGRMAKLHEFAIACTAPLPFGTLPQSPEAWRKNDKWRI